MAALKMLHQDWVESIQTRDQSPSSLHTQRCAMASSPTALALNEWGWRGGCTLGWLRRV